MSEAPRSTFRFLSGRQVLSLQELVPRQVLSVEPVERTASPEDEDALIYIFVSHRWEKPDHPDESGIQLKTLQGWLLLLKELVLAASLCDASPLSWPENLEDMVEGMPQAASLVSRMRQTALAKKNCRKMLQDPLDHIYVWYDCACLPQKFPVERTASERGEFAEALGHLDWLVSQCELVCLRTLGDDYEQRAWCAFERFQKSLYKFEGDITLDCERFLDRAKVEWFVQKPVEQQQEISPEPSMDIPQDSSTLMSRPKLKSQVEAMQRTQQQNMIDLSRVTADSRRIQFKQLQDNWKWDVACDKFKQKPDIRRVPDMCEVRNRIRRLGSQAPEAPALQKAMEQLSRELHSAIFSMSCRDAARLADVSVPAYFEACIPDVGIECGLHKPTTPLQHRRLRQLIDSDAADLFPNDSKQPAKTLATNDKVELCERRVTIDLYQLARSTLSRFGLSCTNDGDVAFVAILALKNFLTKAQREENKLMLSAGALRHLDGFIQSAAEIYALQLARNEAITTFPVIVSLKAPRWVLLDFANLPTNIDASLLDGRSLLLGQKTEQYLQDNSECVSFSFPMHDEALQPLSLRYCSDSPSCNSSWSPCKHSVQTPHPASLILVPSTLDPWETTRLPLPLERFGCAVVNDCIFVIGGATEEDPDTQELTTCSAKTFVCRFPLTTKASMGSVWSTVGELITPRRNHATSVLKDDHGAAIAIAVSGGRTSTTPGREASALSSIELLWLDRSVREWEEGPTMPCARTSHHMVSLEGSLFLFGGGVENSDRELDCDIYNMELELWLKGPELPLSSFLGDSILIHDRFVMLFGGVRGQTLLRDSLVLDLKPWLAWCAKGGREDQRPASTKWMCGPSLPSPEGCPNICWAPGSETGREDDWILSIAALSQGNICWGIPLDPASLGTDPAFWSSLEWRLLGATPESIVLGGIVAVRGYLVMMGGRSTDSNLIFGAVHFRRLSSSHSVPLPAPANFRLVQKDIITHYRILLNDLFLAGRLGFPIKEDGLFASDCCTKKLSLLPPLLDGPRGEGNHHYCRRCQFLTQSTELAQRCSDTALYVLQANASSEPVTLCSTCLCELYL